MRKSVLWVGLSLTSLAALLLGQSLQSSGDGFSSLDWRVIHTLSPLPALPVDTTNKYRDSAEAVELGQKLFFTANQVRQARGFLAEGERRAAELAEGKSTWESATGDITLGYYSEIDGSAQGQSSQSVKPRDQQRPPTTSLATTVLTLTL